MFLKFAKTFYLFLIFYMVWFQKVFFTIDNALFLLGSLMIFFWILHKFNTKQDQIHLTKPFVIWLIFFIFILSTGFIIASDKTLLISSVITYAQILIMIFFIIDVSITEKSNNFFIYSFIILAIISAITIIFFGFEANRGQLKLGEISNPNGDGRILVFGIFCMLLLLINNKNKIIIITLLCMVLFTFYAIILTGSRQVFIAGFVLLVLSLTTLVIKKWKKITTKTRLLLVIITFILLLFIVIKYETLFIGSPLHLRLTDDLTADLSRIEMVNVALDYFKKNPFFGLGFDQFRVYYGTYSHSTYTEIISTTGMIGSFLYFLPYIIISYNLIKLDKSAKNSNVSIQTKIYLVLMFTLLFLGTASIHFYEIPENIMLALMISFYYIHLINDNDKKNRNLKSSEMLHKKKYI